MKTAVISPKNLGEHYVNKNDNVGDGNDYDMNYDAKDSSCILTISSNAVISLLIY